MEKRRFFLYRLLKVRAPDDAALKEKQMNPNTTNASPQPPLSLRGHRVKPPPPLLPSRPATPPAPGSPAARRPRPRPRPPSRGASRTAPRTHRGAAGEPSPPAAAAARRRRAPASPPGVTRTRRTVTTTPSSSPPPGSEVKDRGTSHLILGFQTEIVFNCCIFTSCLGILPQI